MKFLFQIQRLNSTIDFAVAALPYGENEQLAKAVYVILTTTKKKLESIEIKLHEQNTKLKIKNPFFKEKSIEAQLNDIRNYFIAEFTNFEKKYQSQYLALEKSTQDLLGEIKQQVLDKFVFNQDLSHEELLKELYEQQFEQYLTKVWLLLNAAKIAPPKIFISYSWGNLKQQSWVHRIAEHLQGAKLNTPTARPGINVIIDVQDNRTNSVTRFTEMIFSVDKVLVVGTKILVEKWKKPDKRVVPQELLSISTRIREAYDKHGVIKVLLEGEYTEAFPDFMRDFPISETDFRLEQNYYQNFFTLLELIYDNQPKAIEIFQSAKSKLDESFDELGQLDQQQLLQRLDAIRVKQAVPSHSVEIPNLSNEESIATPAANTENINNNKTLSKNNYEIDPNDDNKNASAEIAEKLISPIFKQLKELSSTDCSTPYLAQALEYYVDPEVTDFWEAAPSGEFRSLLLGDIQNATNAGRLPKLSEFLLDNQKHILLLFGDSGSGKSLFCKRLEQQLWQDFSDGSWVPLAIELKQYFSENAAQAVHSALINDKQFFEEDIQELKASNSRKLFILDGYDEIVGLTTPNLRMEKLFAQWPNCKVIVTCRTQAIQNNPNYQYNFVPTYSHNVESSMLKEVYLAPFSQQQIEAYLIKYIKKTHSTWDLETYKAKFNEHPELLELIVNPLLLKLVVDSMQSLAEMPNHLPSMKGNSQPRLFTRTDVYRMFIKNWFMREVRRLEGTKLEFPSHFTLEDCENSFQTFSEELAFQMFLLEGKSEVEYKINRRRQGSERNKQWENFFSETDPAIIQKRSGCPLRKVKDCWYGFVHKSFWEFFLACHFAFELGLIDGDSELFTKEGIINNLQLDFNKKLITSEPAVAHFLAEMMQQSGTSGKELLFAIVRASNRKLNGRAVHIMAANAFTILNYARVPFSKEKLEGIHVDYADLQGAIFDSTNLSGSNLTGANLQGAFFVKANLSYCNMDNVYFSEKAHLILGNEVHSMTYIDKTTPYVLVVTQDGNLTQWNLHTREKAVLNLGNNIGKVYCIEPVTENFFIIIGEDACIKLIEITSRAVLRNFAEKADPISSVRKIPSGQQIIAGYHTEHQSILIWDIMTAKEIMAFSLDNDSKICSLQLSEDGSLLVAGSENGTIQWWDLTTKKLLQKQVIPKREGLTQQIWSVHFSPNNQYIASAHSDNCVRIWNVATGNVHYLLAGHTAWVRCVKFSPDGTLIASSSSDRTIHLWEMSSGKLLSRYMGHTNEIYCLQFVPNSQQLISGSRDGTVRFYDISMRMNTRMISGHKGDIWSIQFSPDGKLIASGSWDNTIRYWEPSTGRELRSLADNMGYVGVVQFSPNGQWLASGSDDHKVRLWDVKTDKVIQEFISHTHAVLSLDFSPDQTRLVSGSFDKNIIIWDVATGKVISRFKGSEKDGIRSIQFSADGKLIIASDEKYLNLWDDTGKLLRKLEGHSQSIRAVKFLDNNTAISASMDKTIRIWDITSGKELYILEGHTAGIRCMQLVKDNSGRLLLVSGSEDKTIRIWDLNTRATIAILRGFSDSVSCLSIDQENNIATGSWDHAVRFWRSGLNENKQLEYYLQWSTHAIFSCEDCDISYVTGLSQASQQLLEQGGAKRLENKDKIFDMYKLNA